MRSETKTLKIPLERPIRRIVTGGEKGGSIEFLISSHEKSRRRYEEPNRRSNCYGNLPSPFHKGVLRRKRAVPLLLLV